MNPRLRRPKRRIGQWSAGQCLKAEGNIAGIDGRELAECGADVGCAEVEGQPAEQCLHLRLDTFHDGGAGRVRVAPRTQYGVEDCKLEILVVLVETTELGSDAVVEELTLPTDFVVGDVFGLKYCAISVDAAAFVARRDEGIAEGVFVQRPVEIDLSSQPGIAFLRTIQGLRQDRYATEKELRDTGGLEAGLRIARADLQFEGIGKFIASLSEDAPALPYRVVFKPVEREPCGGRAARRQRQNELRSIQIVVLIDAAQHPSEGPGIRRHKVDLFRNRPVFGAGDKYFGTQAPRRRRRRAVCIQRIRKAPNLIARNRLQSNPVRESIAELLPLQARKVRIRCNIEDICRQSREGSRGRSAMIDIVVVELEHSLEVVRGLPQRAQAPVGFMEFAGIAGVGPRHMKERVAVLIVGRHPYGQSVGQRDIQGAADSRVIVVAILALDPAAKSVESRISLVDEDSAAGSVLTGERTLRAAQDFNAGDVVIGFVRD